MDSAAATILGQVSRSSNRSLSELASIAERLSLPLENAGSSWSSGKAWDQASCLPTMMASGVLIYGTVGLCGIFLGGNFLDYSVLLSDSVAGQQLGILLIEAGVGITVCSAMLFIFHAFAVREVK